MMVLKRRRLVRSRLAMRSYALFANVDMCGAMCSRTVHAVCWHRWSVLHVVAFVVSSAYPVAMLANGGSRLAALFARAPHCDGSSTCRSFGFDLAPILSVIAC